MPIRPTNKGFLEFCAAIGYEPPKKNNGQLFKMYECCMNYFDKERELVADELHDLSDYLKEPITITKEDELKHKVEHGSTK